MSSSTLIGGLVVLGLVAAQEDLLSLYGAPGGEGGEGSENPAILALSEAIPGSPGEDYPIYSTPPETSFTCNDGKIEGYYADPEAECQSFHICANDGNGGLLKYSFLCPNGTVFNQAYFICDWWFNFDCSTAEDFYYINEEVAAAAAAATAGALIEGGGQVDIGSLNARSGRKNQGFGNEVPSSSGEQRVTRRQQIENLPVAFHAESSLGGSFPGDRIPLQVIGGNSRGGAGGRRGLRKGRKLKLQTAFQG